METLIKDLRFGSRSLSKRPAFTAIAVKLALLKWRPTVAYDMAPWLGRYAAFAFVVIWVTSVLAYYTDIL